MGEGPRVLLGAVPFGCDNVGDEAILECAVGIFREVSPECVLTVCTRDPAGTARKLGVRVCELFGFPPMPPPARFQQELKKQDVFVWCGATGLSDYPMNACALMETAQQARKKTVLWGVGMNSELNPALHRVLPGRRRRLLQTLGALTLGRRDFVARREARMEQHSRRLIARVLNLADLVVVRDPESREEVRRSGVTREVVVGADSAMELRPVSLETLALGPHVRELLHADAPKIGVCVSAQRALENPQLLTDYLNELVESRDCVVVFVPMNPVTDAALMRDLWERLRRRDRAVVLEGRYEPAEVLSVVSHLDLVVSSRLHLLIFAANVHVPIIGISRGSKVDNFLRAFGLEPVGCVEEWDPGRLRIETDRLLEGRPAFEERSRQIRAERLERLAGAKRRLRQVLR